MQLVDTRPALEEVARSLRDSPALYLDTEFESSRDGATLCLLQISSGADVHLIDTLRLASLEPLQDVLANPHCEWVMHAGGQDVPLITSRVGITLVPRLFDTQVAWALSSAEYSVSLAYLQYRLLGVRSAKTHQADDWKRRPLPRSQLAYAKSDVEYLPALRRTLGETLRRLGREQLVATASRELLVPDLDAPASLSLDSFRNAWQLEPQNQAALRFLIEWFNALGANERAAAPDPKTLLSIATRLPRSADDLARIKGVPRRWVSERGATLLKELLRASASASAAEFAHIEPPPYATFEEIRIEAWLQAARAQVCSEVGIAPELAFPGRILRHMRDSIAATNDAASAAAVLRSWRTELLAATYLDYCRRAPLGGEVVAPAPSQGNDLVPAAPPDPGSNGFGAELAHDLRNPLSAITSALALLRRSDHPPAATRWLTIIDRQVQRLVDLVDEHLASRGVSIPPADGPPSETEPRSPESALLPPVAMRVLIVDDNVDAATTLAELVTAWGHRVAVAHDGTAALEVVADFAPDVVVLDIGLPGMSGYDVAERLREKGSAASIIALTGYGEKHDRDRAKAAGFSRHMIKPVDASALKTAIGEVKN
jgi:ribonuclease D